MVSSQREKLQSSFFKVEFPIVSVSLAKLGSLSTIKVLSSSLIESSFEIVNFLEEKLDSELLAQVLNRSSLTWNFLKDSFVSSYYNILIFEFFRSIGSDIFDSSLFYSNLSKYDIFEEQASMKLLSGVN